MFGGGLYGLNTADNQSQHVQLHSKIVGACVGRCSELTLSQKRASFPHGFVLSSNIRESLTGHSPDRDVSPLPRYEPTQEEAGMCLRGSQTLQTITADPHPPSPLPPPTSRVQQPSNGSVSSRDTSLSQPMLEREGQTWWPARRSLQMWGRGQSERRPV